MLAVPVALELEHAVDEVLEDARPRHRAVLRDVADEEDGDAGLLRHPQEPRGRFTHLGDRARRRAKLRGVERLHGVDDADTPGRSRSSVAQTASSSVSARISTFPPPPSRSARSRPGPATPPR